MLQIQWFASIILLSQTANKTQMCGEHMNQPLLSKASGYVEKEENIVRACTPPTKKTFHC